MPKSTVKSKTPLRYSVTDKSRDALVHAVDNTTNQKVLIRRYKAKDEYDILCQLDHPNITRALDYWIADVNDPFEKGLDWWECYTGRLVTPFLGTCDLIDLAYRRDELTKKEKHTVVLSMLEGLSYLHTLGRVHGDLHDMNVRVDEKTYQSYLIDFEYCDLLSNPLRRWVSNTPLTETARALSWMDRLLGYKSAPSLSDQFYLEVKSCGYDDGETNAAEITATARLLLSQQLAD